MGCFLVFKLRRLDIILEKRFFNNFDISIKVILLKVKSIIFE